MIYNPNRKGPELRIHSASCADIKRDLRGATSDMVNEYESVEAAAEDFYADFIDEGSMTVEDTIGYSEFLPCTSEREKTMTTPSTTPKTPATPAKRTRSTGRSQAGAPRRTSGRKVTPKDAAAASAVLDASRTEKAAAAKAEPTPAADPQPTPTPKRPAKQDLARNVVEAVAGIFSDSVILDRLATAGMSKEDAQQIVSQWLHHLPTGSDGDQRYWPASMPRPNRSDWK
jgi:hypothetical protein